MTKKEKKGLVSEIYNDIMEPILKEYRATAKKDRKINKEAYYFIQAEMQKIYYKKTQEIDNDK